MKYVLEYFMTQAYIKRQCIQILLNYNYWFLYVACENKIKMVQN